MKPALPRRCTIDVLTCKVELEADATGSVQGPECSGPSALPFVGWEVDAEDMQLRAHINGQLVRSVARWLAGSVVVLHGLIHLMGAAKGLGWADVSQLVQPIGTGLGAVWLGAAVVTVASGVLLIARVRWWWMVGAVAVVSSQIVIVTSWADAKVGTLANVLLLVSVIYGWASQGPKSGRAEYRRRATHALAMPSSDDVVTVTDMAHLPTMVAAYVRRSGALGQPHMRTLHALFHGRIRGGPTSRG